MARKSIGSLYGIIDGTGEPWIKELNRADRETRARAASMAGAVDKLGSEVTKSFSAAKFGKDLLQGFGVGSAAGVVMTVADHFVGMWKESEEYAKRLEESAARIAEEMRSLSKMRIDTAANLGSPEQRLNVLNAEAARLAGVRDAAAERRSASLEGFAWARDESEAGWRVGWNGITSGATNVASFNGEDFRDEKGIGMQIRPFADLMQKRADEAQKDWIAAEKSLLGLATQIATTIGELAEKAKREEEKAKKEAEALDKSQLDATLAGAKRFGVDMASWKEIGPEDEARWAEIGVKDLDERRKQGETYLERLTREAGELRVDESTRRGLGTGVNYAAMAQGTQAALKEIADLIRHGLRQRSMAQPGFTN